MPGINTKQAAVEEKVMEVILHSKTIFIPRRELGMTTAVFRYLAWRAVGKGKLRFKDTPEGLYVGVKIPVQIRHEREEIQETMEGMRKIYVPEGTYIEKKKRIHCVPTSMENRIQPFIEQCYRELKDKIYDEIRLYGLEVTGFNGFYKNPGLAATFHNYGTSLTLPNANDTQDTSEQRHELGGQISREEREPEDSSSDGIL